MVGKSFVLSSCGCRVSTQSRRHSRRPSPASIGRTWCTCKWRRRRHLRKAHKGARVWEYTRIIYTGSDDTAEKAAFIWWRGLSSFISLTKTHSKRNSTAAEGRNETTAGKTEHLETECTCRFINRPEDLSPWRSRFV